MRFAAVSALSFLLLASCSSIGVPKHEGPPSDHFDGESFFTPWPEEQGPRPASGGILRFLARRLAGSGQGEWPEWVSQPPGPKPPERVKSGIRITFVGHSTLLVQVAGVNLLTDPVWAHRIGPNRLMNARRYKNPGIRFEDLPPIDAVVVSHNHYDHMDLLTLRRLKAPRVIVPLGNAAYLAGSGIAGAQDLDWWQALELAPGVRVRAVPVQHWSTRLLVDRNRALWAGYVLETPAGSIFFAGDTGYGPFVQQIRERLGKMRVALLPIGAYVPASFRRNHIDPAEAVRMHRELGAEHSIPMHYGTFRQSEESYEQPLIDLSAALDAQKIAGSAFQPLREGEAWEVAR